MRELVKGLWIGDNSDCGRHEGFSVIHACKHPCHARVAGQPKRGDPTYFSVRDGENLYLNIIDPPAPLFDRQLFDDFLDFTSDAWTRGRKLMIHCNKGGSRAPTLALLWLAKCAQTIPNRSFDDAWDAFEGIVPDYHPGLGIEAWMREHWHSIKPRPVGFIAGAGPDRIVDHGDKVAVDLTGLSEEDAIALVMGSPLLHFSGFETIEDKKHERIRPIPNILQIRIAEAYEWCLLNNIPPRLLVLKPRQVGSSTFVGELFYHHARRFHCDGMIIGDEASRTEKVWQIFTQYSDFDEFPWNSTVKYNTEKCRFYYADGQMGIWEHDTANDPKAGISGTRQAVWLTEAARYNKSGVRTDVKVITAVLNSLAKVPHSLACAESTAEGAAGWFYDTWQGAATLEDCKAMRFGNGWIKIFAGWFEFAEHRLQRSPATQRYFNNELSSRERRGVELHGWSAEQIAWRRDKIENECANDERVFDQDYPENDIDCFLSSGRPRFNNEGLARLEKLAKHEHDLAEIGVLEERSGALEFRIDKQEGWLWVRERPKFGCSYIAFIDPCSGQQSKGAKNPDAHAPGIIRAAYVDDAGFHPAELVAAIHVENGCRWDDSLIAERLTRLANWYGGCMVVPETGNGLGVLIKLKDYGATVYQREKFDKTIPGQKHDVDGWETNSQTRDIWVGAVADAIREQERAFNCCYRPAVKEMRTFVINDRGKAEAKGGCHDDWVAGIGLGLACIRYASMYRPLRQIPEFAPAVDRSRSRATYGSGAFS